MVSLGSSVDPHPGWGEASETLGTLCGGFCSCRVSSGTCPAHMGPNSTQEVNVRVPWLSLLSEFSFFWVLLLHCYPSMTSAFYLPPFPPAWTCPPELCLLSSPSAGLNLPEHPVGGFSVLDGMFEDPSEGSFRANASGLSDRASVLSLP